MMDWSAAIPAMAIALREGVEAFLAVGIVLAYLDRVGQQQLYSWVFGGCIAGVIGSLFAGAVLQRLMQWVIASHEEYAPIIKPLLEGSITVLAIGLLSWMLVWMARQARQIKGETEKAVQSALDQGKGAALAVATLAGVAVMREGIELVVFLSVQVQEGGLESLTMLVGVLVGLAGAVAIGLMVFRWGIRINLKWFFQVMGVVLLAIVAGLVVSALGKFDRAAMALTQIPDYVQLCGVGGPVCYLGASVWNLSGILPQQEFPGIVLRALFGYTEKLYMVQAIAYVMFWVIVGGTYWRSLTTDESV